MDDEPVRDLKIEVFIGDETRYYRVTHIPSEFYAEAATIAEAAQAVENALAVE